jgi:glycosyltransferase involved in cell wall biosynthesis
MSRLKLTYVLPVYNAQESFYRAFKSIKDQKVKGQIIVIDDGSVDATPVLIDHVRDDIDILITNEERMGAAYCRNLGNSKAKGDIIVVCDVDQYYSDRSDCIVKFFQEFKDKDIFYSGLHIRPYNDMQGMYQMEAYEWDFKSKCPISHPTVAYRKKVAEQVKYPQITKDSDMFEFFLLKAHKKGFKFHGAQNPLMLKVEGDSKRDVSKGKDLKRRMYNRYGIII